MEVGVESDWVRVEFRTCVGPCSKLVCQHPQLRLSAYLRAILNRKLSLQISPFLPSVGIPSSKVAAKCENVVRKSRLFRYLPNREIPVFVALTQCIGT